jgi:hypothetical protein
VQSNEHGKIKIYKPKRTDLGIEISGGDGGIDKKLESFPVNVAIILDCFFSTSKIICGMSLLEIIQKKKTY